VSHTSEQRDHLSIPLCGARKKNGQTCRAFAGQGTNHLGFGTCRYHGGSTPNQVKRAEREMVEAEVSKLGQPIDTTPGRAIEALLRQSTGMVVALSLQVEQGETLDPNVLSMFNSERDRLARFAKTAADMGIDVARLKIARKQTALMSAFLEGVINRIDLTPEQRAQLGPAIREEMATIVESTAVEIEDEDSSTQPPKNDTEIFASRRQDAEELGLWRQVTNSDEAAQRREELAGLGFEDYGDDRWDRLVWTLRAARGGRGLDGSDT
jgi:hypothetical protein